MCIAATLMVRWRNDRVALARPRPILFLLSYMCVEEGFR